MFESLEIIQGGGDKNEFVAGNARIKVIGVGGGGGNAVDNMIEEKLDHVDYIVANTDAQALRRSSAAQKIQVGSDITRGLGAGANPEVGYRAALDSEGDIRKVIGNAEMVFVTAGMGGGTGTGAAPVIARIAREMGALTVGVVTRPFTFEGRARAKRAESGLKDLAEAVDTIIVIPNDRLLELADENTSLKDGFKLADTVLLNAVRGISDIIVTPGLINVDFADVVHIMQSRGLALMGTGVSSGQNRAREAAQKAINSPLLEDIRIEGATGLLVNITGGPTTSLREVNEALSMIQDAVHEDTDTIFGAVIDDRMGDELKITVVATGYTRVEPSFDDDRNKIRSRFGTGKTPAVPRPSAPQPMAAPPAVPQQAMTPLPLPQMELEAEEPVMVPTYGGEGTVYAQAHQSRPHHAHNSQQMPQVERYHHGTMEQPPPVPPTHHHEIHAHSMQAQVNARPLTAPTPGVEAAPARNTQPPPQPMTAQPQRAELLDDLQAPAFLRSRETGKRQPVVHNPFTVEASREDLDVPTFLRTK